MSMRFTMGLRHAKRLVSVSAQKVSCTSLSMRMRDKQTAAALRRQQRATCIAQ